MTLTGLTFKWPPQFPTDIPKNYTLGASDFCEANRAGTLACTAFGKQDCFICNIEGLEKRSSTQLTQNQVYFVSDKEEAAEATAPQSKESVSKLDALLCGLRKSLLSHRCYQSGN